MRKLLILTTQPGILDLYDHGQIGSHSNWGITELRRKYETKILNIGNTNIFRNTRIVLKEDFDVLFMHNSNPFRIVPVYILRALFPSFRYKKIMAISHASVWGKSNKPLENTVARSVISWVFNGYNKLLFFSPKSASESVQTGIKTDKCEVIHWGADLKYVQSQSIDIGNEGYWLSSGKERRDFDTLEKAASLVRGASTIKILRGGKSYPEILYLTARSTGIVVVPQKKALNYCVGLTCVMDAFALGKPIVAVRNPYWPFDIEKEGCGIFVNAESPNEIVDVIKIIEKNPDLYKTMCKNSKRMSEIYNMEQYKNELYRIVDDL